jgi:hypothetical protein
MWKYLNETKQDINKVIDKFIIQLILLYVYVLLAPVLLLIDNPLPLISIELLVVLIWLKLLD